MGMVGKLVFLIAMAIVAIFMVDAKALLAKGVENLEHAHPQEPHHLDRVLYATGSLRSYQCPSQCSRRCSQTQYKKPCLFFCNKCCNACLCVPPGYYGNKGACPCYNNWKTKRGGPKCP